MDIRTATPVEIDTELARLYGENARLVARLTGAQRALKRYQKINLRAEIERTEAEINALEAQTAVLRDQVRPLNDEFLRRGGWNRAFLVTNAGGHVHNTMDCNTCYATTQFAWLTEFSAKDEAQVVEAAGEKACTVCFPTAPVDVLRRKSTIELPERRAARLERERKATERAAKAAETGITNPDGTPLRTDWGPIKTERTAWIALTDDIFLVRFLGYQPRYDADNAALVAALMAKTGKTEQEITAEADKKAAAKAKREGVFH